MAQWVNVCRYFPTAGGTTDWTFSSAVQGYQSPASAGIVNSTLYKYRAESSDLSQWEVGEGTYTTGTGVLTRATVLYNSSATGTGAGQSGAGTKISFTNIPQVAIVALKEDLANLTTDNTFTGDIIFTGSAWTITSPTPTASSGTFTSVSASVHEKKFGKVCIITATVTVTTVGTAAGQIFVPIPTAAAVATAGCAINNSNGAVNMVCQVSGSTMAIVPTAGIISSGNNYFGQATYEIA